MPSRRLPHSAPAGRSGRALLFAASLLALLLGGCDDRGDLLGVELAVFTLGEWAGTGPQGEEFRLILERDGDDVVLTAFLVTLPGLRDAATGQDEACGALVDAFTRFGNSNANVRIRGGEFRFRTPNDFRVDSDGLIEADVVGRFESPDSATVDADIEIDATRFVACRVELTASWVVEPVAP